MKRSIYIYAPSPSATMAFTPDMLYTRGLGGAETGIVILTREWATRGHDVHFFGNAHMDAPQVYDGVTYHHKHTFPLFSSESNLPQPDVLIIYRAAAEQLIAWCRVMWPKTKIVAFSTDQATEGNYATWLASVDRTVTISPFHTQFLIEHYFCDPDTIGHIDLPIVARDYAHYNDKPRENLFLWSSQHERGLARLALVWWQIRDAIPDARLIITADHTLWGVTWNSTYEAHQRSYRNMFSTDTGVEFLAAIPRQELVSYQKQAKIQLSSLTYEELFGISVMEAQAAGAIPVVGSMGALPTTVMVGECVPGNMNNETPLDAWVERVLDWAKRPDLPELSRKAHEMAMARCHPSTVADQWENLFDSLYQERKG